MTVAKGGLRRRKVVRFASLPPRDPGFNEVEEHIDGTEVKVNKMGLFDRRKGKRSARVSSLTASAWVDLGGISYMG